MTDVDNCLVTFPDRKTAQKVIDFWGNCGQKANILDMSQCFIDAWNQTNRHRYVIKLFDGEYAQKNGKTLEFLNEIEARRYSYRFKSAKVQKKFEGVDND